MTTMKREWDILRALADGEERHGYALMCAVEEHTGGRVILGPGTLYRVIGRLLDDGLIVEAALRPDPALDDERRRYYRITPAGRALLDRPGTPLPPLAPPPPSDAHPPGRQYDLLQALADGEERHGYALLGALRALPGGAPIGPITLYHSLRSLLTDGLIVEAALRPDPALDDEPRDYYRITPQGAEALRTPGRMPRPDRTAAQERAYAVLCALADGAEHHGYGLVTALRAAPAGAGRVGSGTIYRILDDLLADGLVAEGGAYPDPAVNPAVPRRHYRRTPRGEEAQRLLAALPPHQPAPAPVWRGAVAFGVAWGTATGGLLLLLGAGGAGWATGAVATVVTTGAGLLRRAAAA
jgi:DNA-binding PadR family transcriptional regulator